MTEPKASTFSSKKGTLKKCPVRTPICIAKWRSPKRGRWGTHSHGEREPLGVRTPGFLRSVGDRRSKAMEGYSRLRHLRGFRLRVNLLQTLKGKMGLVVWLERVRTSAHQGVQLQVANEALWHGGWPQSCFIEFYQHLATTPISAHIRRPYLALRSVTERTSSASFRSQHVVIGQ